MQSPTVASWQPSHAAQNIGEAANVMTNVFHIPFLRGQMALDRCRNYSDTTDFSNGQRGTNADMGGQRFHLRGQNDRGRALAYSRLQNVTAI
jgi:hypothetical protein